jgi:hypothetical protein
VVVHVCSDLLFLDVTIFISLAVDEGEELVPKCNLCEGTEGYSVKDKMN